MKKLYSLLFIVSFSFIASAQETTFEDADGVGSTLETNVRLTGTLEVDGVTFTFDQLPIPTVTDSYYSSMSSSHSDWDNHVSPGLETIGQNDVFFEIQELDDGGVFSADTVYYGDPNYKITFDYVTVATGRYSLAYVGEVEEFPENPCYF